MSNFSAKIRQFLLFTGDVVFLYLSLILTLLIRHGQFDATSLNEHVIPFTIMNITWLIVFYGNGFYDLNQAKNNIGFWNAILRTMLLNAGLGITLFYFVPIFQVAPKINLIIYLLIFSALFIIWRQLFNFISKSLKLRQTILFLGKSAEADNLITLINENPQLGYSTGEYLDPSQISNVKELANILISKNIKIIVVAGNHFQNPETTKLLYDSLNSNIRIFNLPTFYEKITGKIPVAEISQIWFLENLQKLQQNTYEMLKRIFDVILALFIGIITLPFYPILALLVKLSSPGPIFYRQTRMGKNRKVFTITKFRSMVNDAETGKPLWKTEKDPRVTTIGKFLRRSFLDEIPQLKNVLRGEMSFIGPRPERPEFIEKLEKEIPYYHIRHLVTPGLSGWAQINFRYAFSVSDAQEKLQYDIYYVKNRSLILDIGIALKTIKLIFKER